MTRAVPGAQVRSAPDGNLVIGVDGDPRAWVRVANIVLEGICSGALGAGGRIPPAAVLATQAGCAAGTVRRALRHPAAVGLIAWYPGAGYRVLDGAAGGCGFLVHTPRPPSRGGGRGHARAPRPPQDRP